MTEYTLQLDLAAYHREVRRELEQERLASMYRQSCETCDAGTCTTCSAYLERVQPLSFSQY